MVVGMAPSTGTATVGIVDEAVNITVSIDEFMENMERLLGGTQRRVALTGGATTWPHLSFASDVELHTCIQAGIQKLHEMYGGAWWHTLDLRLLNINSARDCVLGQLYGSFYAAPLLGTTPTEEQMRPPYVCDGFHTEEWYTEARRCGFILSHPRATTLWREALTHIRQESSPPPMWR